MPTHRNTQRDLGEQPAKPVQPASERKRGRLRRAVSLGVGGALLVRGVRRRSLAGTAGALLGGVLVARELGGTARLREALGVGRSGERSGAGGTAIDAPTAATRSITIDRPAGDLYDHWRDSELLSRMLGDVVEITALDDDRFRWTIDGPAGKDVSWETYLIESTPGERLRWESYPDAVLPNEGTVTFEEASGGRGTTVTFTLRFDPPGGSLGEATLERLDIVPRSLVGKALDNCKSLAETGEIPTLRTNPSGRGRGDRL